MSTRPTRVRTWAPRGQTPVLHETFNWKSLSIIGGLALWRFYFQIHAGSIKSLQVIEFLRHLQRHVRGKMLVLWDGAPIHRSLLVKHYVASTRGRLVVERLPAYAPELNPVEYMWGHLKTHAIANLIVTQAWAIVLQDGKQITEFREGILPWAYQRNVALVFDEYDAGRPRCDVRHPAHSGILR